MRPSWRNLYSILSWIDYHLDWQLEYRTADTFLIRKIRGKWFKNQRLTWYPTKIKCCPLNGLDEQGGIINWTKMAMQLANIFMFLFYSAPEYWKRKLELFLLGNMCAISTVKFRAFLVIFLPTFPRMYQLADADVTRRISIDWYDCTELLWKSPSGGSVTFRPSSDYLLN